MYTPSAKPKAPRGSHTYELTFPNYGCFKKRRVKEVMKSRDVEGKIRIISLKIAFLIFQN